MIAEEQQVINFFTDNTKLLKIVGYNDEKTYNYLIRKVYQESLKHNNCKTYDKGFPKPSDMNIISIVQQSVENMDLNNLANEDIILTNNGELNYRIKNAIVQILQPLIINGKFSNDMIKSNFVVKHIVWLYERINEYDWISPNKPIMILYGEYDTDELYHIELLNLIGIKALYVNSSRNVILNNYSKIEENSIIFNSVTPIESYGIRVANGVDTLNIPNTMSSTNNEGVITTWAKQAKDELHKELYDSNGVFRPWQFKDGTTKPLYIDAVIEDIETYWTTEARFRPEFKVEGLTVYVPNFISKINGTYADLGKYKKLVNFTKDSKLTLFKEGVELLNRTYTNEEMYSLMFTIENDEVNYEKIKSHKLYGLSKINVDVQNYIIRKINDFINLYKDKIDMKYILDVIATIITMNDEYVTLIERFDFPFKVPKLVIYISDRSNFDKRTGLFLNYLNTLGLDIIVYSPTGSSSIEEHMYGTPLNIITLDEMNFDIEYSKLSLIKIKEKTSLLRKLFSK